MFSILPARSGPSPTLSPPKGARSFPASAGAERKPDRDPLESELLPYGVLQIAPVRRSGIVRPEHHEPGRAGPNLGPVHDPSGVPRRGMGGLSLFQQPVHRGG